MKGRCRVAADDDVIVDDPVFDQLIDPGAEMVQIGAGYQFSEGPVWNHPRAGSLLQRHPRRRPLALDGDRRHGAGGGADVQGQRAGLRRRRQPAGVRAGVELPHPDPSRRSARARRLARRRRLPEQPERRRRSGARRQHLLHRSRLRAMERLDRLQARLRPRGQRRLPRPSRAAGRSSWLSSPTNSTSPTACASPPTSRSSTSTTRRAPRSRPSTCTPMAASVRAACSATASAGAR